MPKLFMFLYYAGQFGCGKPDSLFRIKAGNGQNLAIALVGPVFFGVAAWVAHSSGFYDFLAEHWSIDYGRVHSKNFSSPWVVVAVLSLVILHFTLKLFIASDTFQLQIKHFKERIIIEKADKLLWLPPLVVLMSALLTLCLFGMLIWGGVFVFLVFLVLEIYLRNSIVK